MTEKERFLQTFEAELQLPDRLSGSYTPDHCLCCREDHCLWLLRRRADGEPAALVTGGPEAGLQEQFAMLVRAQQAAPGQVPVPLDCFEEQGVWYLLRSWLPGQDLVQWRAARGGCSDRQCARIGREVCAILQVLHSLEPPIIHRDLKPENILLDDRGRVQLLDFGIARVYRPGAAHDTCFLGTEATAAPEQYGYAQTDPRTDVYGLGMTLLYLCTGSYDREQLQEVRPRLRRVLLKATDFGPDRRYGSAGALAEALTPRPGLPTLRNVLLTALSLVLVGTVGVQRQVLHRTQVQLTESMEQLQELQLQEERRREPVQFPSTALEQAIRQELQQPEGPIPAEDLSLVRQLTLTHCTELDLAFLQTLPRLHTLWITDYPAANLEPLNLPNLNMVTVERGLGDLTGAEQLQNLETFSLIDCEAGDLGPLQRLEKLISINLDGPPVDYGQLNELPGLLYVRVPAAYHDQVLAACPDHPWELLS